MTHYEIREGFIGGAHLEVAPERYASLIADLETIRLLLQIETSFDLFARSVVDFEKYLLVVALENSIGLNLTKDLRGYFDEILALTCLKLMTIMTSFKSFVDIPQSKSPCVASSLKRNILSQFISIQKEAERKNFYIKFFAKLRDYAQHHDLPIGGFLIDSDTQWENIQDRSTSPHRRRYNASPYLKVDQLLSDVKFNAAIGAKLKQFNVAKIDLKAVLRSFSGALYRSFQDFRDESESAVTTALSNLLEASNELKNKKGGEVKHLYLIQNSDTSHLKDYMDVNFISRIEDRRGQWKGLDHYETAFISSEIMFESGKFPESHKKIWISAK